MPCSHVHALRRKVPEYHSQQADGGPHPHSLLGSLFPGMQAADTGLSFSTGRLGLASHM